MFKEKTFLVADTETTGLGGRAHVFDFAYVIATRKRDILERSFLVREVATNPAIMLSAFVNSDWRDFMGRKLFTHYIPTLAAGELPVTGWRTILETMRDDMATHSVDVFSAYNLRFDMGALATTHGYIGHHGKILAQACDVLCLWEFACQTVCASPMYHRVAHELGQDHGWITDAGNVRTNAEKTYAFLTNQWDFVESHTALADAQIETEILRRLLAKKKRIPYNVMDHMPWRKAQNFGLEQRNLL